MCNVCYNDGVRGKPQNNFRVTSKPHDMKGERTMTTMKNFKTMFENDREGTRNILQELRAAVKTLETIHNETLTNDGTPGQTVTAFIEAVGYDTACDVIASLVNVSAWDGRISSKSVQWSETVGTSLDEEAARNYGIYSDRIHKAHLDQIARAMMEQPEPVDEDPERVTAEIIDWFEEHESEYVETIEELDDWNGYLNDDRYWNMSDLNDLYCNESPEEILRRAYFGYDGDSPEENRRQFNPMSEYFHFNGYGNLVSSDSKDYSAHLDHWFVESCLEHMNDLWSIKANPELSDLFDRLEAAQSAGKEA